ncbi:DUF4397 domain-containing protein [Pedobacter sp. Leaf132]|uniref:DUF4397 domain-containing protein n=1 Tax=Pedobacter sp. Leaf132 TaxID=2876557 RepID=UPI001E42852B|nr:DUF4397 domain-containing protein [Pedobacter sp. Leaf132]
MKIKLSSNIKFVLVLVIASFSIACVKNDNNDYDTRVRFLNAIDQGAQDFYLNGLKVAPAVVYGSSSSYITAAGDKEYNVYARGAGTSSISDSIKYLFSVGKNYTVYYTKKSATDSVLTVLEDDLARDASSVRLFFINLGYNLSSNVNIRNESSSVVKILGPGENSGYIKLPVDADANIYLNLLASPNVTDTILNTNFVKGNTYTIMIDGVNKGTNAGKLQKRVIVSSN